MIKLVKLLSEILNTYTVECNILSDSSYNITDILDSIRALEKVTIVNNTTPVDYPQKENIEFTSLNIKFVTRSNPKEDLKNFKKEMLTSEFDKDGAKSMRIPGIKSVKFKEETIKRV